MMWFIILLCYLLPWTAAEFFTSISDMEVLVETHGTVIENIRDYLRKEENRLHGLKRYLDLYKKEQDLALNDVSNYVGNPINAFILIKRLTSDLDDIEQRTKITTGHEDSYSLRQNVGATNISYPSYKDLQGAAYGLQGLADLYKLNTMDLAEGILNGVHYCSPMSASDCFNLGKALRHEKLYGNALQWMKEALRKYQDDDHHYNFNKSYILQHIGATYFDMEDTENALKWTLKALEENPENTHAKENAGRYQKVIYGYIEKPADETDDSSESSEEEEDPLLQYSYEVYEGLCRGELELPADLTSKLTCRYLSDKPFLKLAPVKMEQKYINPDVYVFHDVISDEEIQHVKNMTIPELTRALIHAPDNASQSTESLYRISKATFLHDWESSVVERISRRVSHLTGLDIYSSEPLQVINYGVGGYYSTHIDFLLNEQLDMIPDSDVRNFTKYGNRIATVLFYMTDVEQGGATVFPKIGLSVFPEKGSALYWTNLHPSCEGDMATAHSGCPVLIGSKWVCNKLLHQMGQELTKPCNLEFQSEGLLKEQYPVPVPKAGYT